MSYTYEYPRACVTSDIVVFSPEAEGLEVLLIKRANEPYAHCWALPGGFLDMEETIEQCAARELQEETGISGIPLYQLKVFSDIHRDPRHRTLSVAFWGVADKAQMAASAGDDAEALQWFAVEQLPSLAFDHKKIIEMAAHRFLEEVSRNGI